MPDVPDGRVGNDPSAKRTRELIERLVREGTVVARSDGSVHQLFPVSVSAAEGQALRGWVEREQAARTHRDRVWVRSLGAVHL